ncbi:MAG: hypothetical protein K5989_05505 [Lachnospiraceae bacterium]|nr:hypothetical protein [Lachnospiraceae bacterium]
MGQDNKGKLTGLILALVVIVVGFFSGKNFLGGGNGGQADTSSITSTENAGTVETQESEDESGQTAGGSGQTAGGSSQTAGGSSQTAGGSGQSAGGIGQTAGGSSQTAGGSSQAGGADSSNQSGDTAGGKTGSSTGQADSADEGQNSGSVEPGAAEEGKADSVNSEAALADTEVGGASDSAGDSALTGRVTEEGEPVPDFGTLSFRYKDRLMDHYKKHGIEMGFDSPEAYAEAANAVVHNPDALIKLEEEDGDYVFYVEDSNEFVIVSRDGYLRTYFYPNGGMNYYLRQ